MVNFVHLKFEKVEIAWIWIGHYKNLSMERKETWNFPRAFWVANTVELFERAAYYGVFIVITLYLSRIFT